MRKFPLILAGIIVSFTSFAQYKGAIWEPNPHIHNIPDEFQKESAVFILDERDIQYVSEGKDLIVRRTVHRVVKVLDDKGIESFNKMSISTSSKRSVDNIRARTILPDGKVINISANKIKLTKNENGGDEYSFAMEGVEKNAEVEFMYTQTNPLSLFGSETLQFSIPVIKASFLLSTPERFRFDVKGYSGFPAATDSIINKIHYYSAIDERVPALKEEPYSNYEVHLRHVDYRLSYSEDDIYVRLFTWNDLVKNLYKTFYTYTNKEERVIEKYLASINVNEKDSELEKIKKIEEAIKTNINISDELSDASYGNFDKIVDKKVTFKEAYTRFFVACLTLADIKHEIGMTTNRFSNPFDETFENWKLLDYYLIYFPRLKQYLSPGSTFLRMPFIPLAATENKGVFCKTSTTSSIRFIPVLPANYTVNGINAHIAFNVEMTPELQVTHSFSGYSAFGLREAFIYTPKDKEREIIQEILGVASADEIENYRVENTAFSNYYDNKALRITANMDANQLLEKAGPKYLLKIGDVIGRQAEMYQEKERTLPIDMPYPHSLERKITIDIPEGYEIANPNVLKIMVDHKDSSGNQTMGFISDYKMENGEMIVNINEFYHKVHYPVTDIEIFRKVINAAADFNKLVLILEKN